MPLLQAHVLREVLIATELLEGRPKVSTPRIPPARHSLFRAVRHPHLTLEVQAHRKVVLRRLSTPEAQATPKAALRCRLTPEAQTPPRVALRNRPNLV